MPAKKKGSESAAKRLSLKATYVVLAAGMMVIVMLVLSGMANGPSVSKVVWNHYHLFPSVAMFFNPGDAMLATDIGFRSFNTFGEDSYDIEKAQYYLYRALEIDPMAPRAWHELGRIDFLNGDFGPAIVKLNRQIALHGDEYMPAYYVRGLTYAFAEEYDEAEADFLTFLESKEESWAANNDLSWVYFRAGDYEKALEHAEKGLIHAPDNPWLLTMQGVSLMNLDQKEQAADVFRHALVEAKKLTKEDWSRTYPGNDPAVAEQGLAEVVQAIEQNLALVD